MDSSPAQGKQSILFCVFTCLKKLATESCHQCKIAHQADVDNCICATYPSDVIRLMMLYKGGKVQIHRWELLRCGFAVTSLSPWNKFPIPCSSPFPTLHNAVHIALWTLHTEYWKLYCTLNTQNWNLNTEYWPLHSTVNTESTTVNTVQYKSTSQLQWVESTSADVLCFKLDFKF